MPCGARWENEKQSLAGVQGVREELEKARRESEEAERKYDLDRLAQLRHGIIPGLEKKLAALQKAEGGGGRARSLLREEVTEEEIAEVVSRWSGIPLTRLLQGEREKLLKLGDVLHEKVIGQDEAVRVVADAVLRARAGIQDPKRPVAPPVPGAHGCRQDGIGQDAGPFAV